MFRWAKLDNEWTIIEELDNGSFLVIGSDETCRPKDFSNFEFGDYIEIPEKYVLKMKVYEDPNKELKLGFKIKEEIGESNVEPYVSEVWKTHVPEKWHDIIDVETMKELSSYRSCIPSPVLRSLGLYCMAVIGNIAGCNCLECQEKRGVPHDQLKLNMPYIF